MMMKQIQSENSAAGEQSRLNSVLVAMSDAEKIAALRFCLTCDDDEGYDVSKSMMKQLVSLGLVKHKGGGWYEQELLLLDIRNMLEAWNETARRTPIN